MRRMIAAAVVALLVGGVGGFVLHGQNQIRTLGSGTISCGKWLADHGPERSSGHWQLEEDWVNGYLTGLQDDGTGKSALTDNQAGDLAGRSAWIDQYCQSHPIDNLLDAAYQLFKALRAKR